MRGSLKSKRVSWASDGNLCQVRLFLSEDNPSQVGLGAQDHLQAKASWMLHSSGTCSDENLPPGFEDASPSNQLENKISQIPLSKWRCPPRFMLNINWQVVAGEESKEVELQNQQEMRVLEAVYPRPSAIPPNPALAMDIGVSPNDDRHTIQIPITPIEEEDGAPDTLPDPVIPDFNISTPRTISSVPISSANEVSTIGLPLGLDPNVLSAASAASIDHELLIKILRNPKLVEKLVTDHRIGTDPQPVPQSIVPQTTVPVPPPVHINRAETRTSDGSVYGPQNAVVGRTSQPETHTSDGSLYGPQNSVVGHVPTSQPAPPGFPVPSAPSRGPGPMVKDLNYYKSLIQQHGGEKHENARMNNSRPRDPKAKMNKPCIYFNSSRGCRNGANCAYRHDASVQQGAKRMKVDRDITGTQSCS